MTLDEGNVPMTKDRSNAMMLGALGALSGAVAWALINLTDVIGLRFNWILFEGGINGFEALIELSALRLFPGLVFGLIIGVLLHRRGKVEGLRAAGYVAAAGLSYLCAFHAAYCVYDNFFSSEWDVVGYVISGIPAGFVGSLLLGLMTMLLLRAPGRLVLQLPVLVGGAAGALLGFLALRSFNSGWGFLTFFVLWQGAYAASLAPLLRAAPISGPSSSH